MKLLVLLTLFVIVAEESLCCSKEESHHEDGIVILRSSFTSKVSSSSPSCSFFFFFRFKEAHAPLARRGAAEELRLQWKQRFLNSRNSSSEDRAKLERRHWKRRSVSAVDVASRCRCDDNNTILLCPRRGRILLFESSSQRQLEDHIVFSLLLLSRDPH